jgi:hypothetical protein
MRIVPVEGFSLERGVGILQQRHKAETVHVGVMF